MDHRPSSHFKLKSQVCLKMTHKDGLTLRKRMQRLLADSLCWDSNFVPKKNGVTFFGDFGLSRLSQVCFGPHGRQRLC